MPIQIPNDLPATEILKQENIFVMNQTRAETQQIRPLEIVLLNLMPTKIVTETQLSRIRSAPTPAASSSASVNCRWVEEAGCRQQVRESATWVSIEPSFRCFIKISAAFLPPWRPKEITPQEPLGRYFCASA